MENFNLNGLCDIIILIGAVIVAVKTIYGFFKKPVDSLSEHLTSKEEEHIKEVIEKNIPDYIKQIDGNVDEIKNSINSIQKSMNLVTNAQLDMMRYDMNKIYYKYRSFKKILDCDKKAFLKFYNDYHEMGGNTWIDSLYPEVMAWETVQDESELVR